MKPIMSNGSLENRKYFITVNENNREVEELPKENSRE